MPDSRGTPYWIICLYTAMALVSVVLIALGFQSNQLAWSGTGFLGLILTLGMVPIALYTRRASSAAGGSPNGSFRELTKAIQELNQVGALSDDARRVLNRGRERDLLRKAINEDIHSGDWDAAMVLVKELAERFGYRADAEEFRRRIDTARFETINTEVDKATAGVDRLISQCRWPEAAAEAARVTRLYPDSDKVAGLRHRVAAALDRYKMDLERRFLLAAESEHIDDAMNLLAEMDGYLTEEEAEPFKEVARGVIGKARENLGVQFKMALQDKRWTDAESVGERVIREFPNTRMADEIRDLIDEIRQRAQAMR